MPAECKYGESDAGNRNIDRVTCLFSMHSRFCVESQVWKIFFGCAGFHGFIW